MPRMRLQSLAVLGALWVVAFVCGCALLHRTPAEIPAPKVPPVIGGGTHFIELVYLGMACVAASGALLGVRRGLVTALAYGGATILGEVLAWYFLSALVTQLIYLIPIIAACGLATLLLYAWTHGWFAKRKLRLKNISVLKPKRGR